MALLDVYGQYVTNPGFAPSTTSLTTFALDATGETTGDGIATVFVPLPNKTISEVYAYITATTGSAPTYRIKVETMSASRTPSNTPATASSWKDVTASGAGGQWVGGALVANHSVGADPSPLAITVRYQSGTCDGSNFSTFARHITKCIDMYSPYSLTMTAGTWGGLSSSGLPTLVVVYNDGTVQPITLYGTGTSFIVNNNSWNTGSNPLYRGNALTPPLAIEVSAVDVVARLPDNWDFRINVYDGTTLIEQTATFDPDVLWGATTAIQPVRIPLTPFTHPASTKYSYVLEPMTANNPTSVIHLVLASAAAQRALGGLLVGTTSPSGSPSWTTYDNGSDGYRLYPVVPVISKIEGGGGAKYRPRMRRAA